MPPCQSDHEHLAAFDRTCSPAPYATVGSRHPSRIFANSAASHNPLACRCLNRWPSARVGGKPPAPRALRRVDLLSLDIPASEVADHCRLLETNPQFRAHRYFETPEHPVVGAMPLPSLPFRYASIDRWLRTSAPTLGQHNELVLREILGLSPSELRDLEADGVIGTHPEGL